MSGLGWAERERRSLAVISVLAALFAGLGYHLLFSKGSLNNDEVAYLLQAKAISRGDLFLAVRQPAAAHRIWFFVERPSGLVSKYLPLVSAVFAVGFVAVGSVIPVLAGLAAALPWLVAGLAREVGLSGRDAVLAAALVSASPLVLMESAMPLSYLLFLVMVTAAWWLLFRIGHGRGGPWSAAALGFLGAAGAATRPYDTVLLLAVGLGWAAWRRRHDGLVLAVCLVAGAVPLAVATAIYDHAATGKAWRLPFGLLEPADKVGFGVRRLFPEQSDHHFGPLQGLAGLGLHFFVGLLTWLALGFVLAPAAVVAWRRANTAVRLLLVSVAVHLAGYWMFWGPWNFSVLWGKGTRVLGPIYAMPLTVPIVLAGLPVVLGWARANHRLGRGLVVAGLAVALLQLGSAVVQAGIDASRTRLLLDQAEAARAEGPLRFDTDPPYLGHPVSDLVDGVALSATSAVPAPGEPAGQLLQLPKAVYGTGTLSYALTRQERVEAPSVPLEVSIVERRANVLVVERAGRAFACGLRSGAPVALRLTPTGVEGCDGLAVPSKWYRAVGRHCPDTTCVSFAAYRIGDDADRQIRLTWRLVPVQPSSSGLALLVDGEVVASGGNGWLRVASP